MSGFVRVLEMESEEYERVKSAVLAWLKEDAPLAAKMNLTPDHMIMLVDRILGKGRKR